MRHPCLIAVPALLAVLLTACGGNGIPYGSDGGTSAASTSGGGTGGSTGGSGSSGGGSGSAGGGSGGAGSGPAKFQEYATKVDKCSTGDKPETALQGQVPASVRALGFKGFNCNMEIVGQFVGEGGNWSTATFRDPAGRHCAYHSTATAKPGRVNPGVPVIDMTDPTKPVRTMSLTTPAMLDPWESLRVNASRQMLFGGNGKDSGGGPEIDIYDLSADCRSPQLLASAAMAYTLADGTSKPMNGHEGNISPDGLTYYVGDLTNKAYHAIDVTNSTRPRLIATFDMNNSPIGKGAHGLSVSKDGNRMYAVAFESSTPADALNPDAKLVNGMVVFDVSDIQARKPGAKFKVVSSDAFKDGSAAQHTVTTRINGKPYLVMVDEGGAGGFPASIASTRAACAAGLSPYPLARIYDMSDETKPRVVSKLKLEVHDVANCDAVSPDVADQALFTYGSHYCSVDDTENATTMACSYFNSGVRVFDIRDPAKPKEIAYLNPPGTMTPGLGSGHVNFAQWRPGGADWCASRLDFDKARGTLTTMCHDNGLIVMKFKNGVWPLN